MLEGYEFEETSSRNVTVDGEVLRVINYRGSDTDNIQYEILDIHGSFTVPLMEYFQAGVDGRIVELIRDYIVGRLTTEEGTTN